MSFGLLQVDFGIVGLKYVVAVLLALSGLFTFWRLTSWLPAIAVGYCDYTLKAAWTMTRSNRIAFLGFTFWLLFSCAVAGAMGAGLVLRPEGDAQPVGHGSGLHGDWPARLAGPLHAHDRIDQPLLLLHLRWHG